MLFLPSSLCLSQGSSSAASAARKSLFSPRTWAGWIPVTSTGMRREEKPSRTAGEAVGYCRVSWRLKRNRTL
ncbi:hypothetical protein GHK48_01445 [Sinorhizobium fredii]|uniref:Uncharacterized protein n=1 Tax=Rhizobium fredii TaxID=380 RepID=A0A844A243_RHIFR|nr:hypothetical protein [Sinorhizobium fredii]UTY47127.1 hypothetical protein EPK84_10155 [Sinorhizobium fredii]